VNYKNYFNDFDDFDEESKRTLQSLSNHLVFKKQFLSKALQKNTDLQKGNTTPLASSLTSDITDWQTDEYINLELLVSKIKYANNGMRDYILEYNPDDYQSKTQNKSISLPGRNFIRLKAKMGSDKNNSGNSGRQGKSLLQNQFLL
jgi:hypothetical protein